MMRHSYRLACYLLFLFVVACADSRTDTPAAPTATAVPGALVVYATETLGPIPPTVYGTNYGPWISVPTGVMDAYQQSGLRLLRFPGGAYGDEHTIRPSQLDMLMQLAGMVDAEAAVSVRLVGGTPEQAVALMAYANQTNDYNVRLWSIGNEPSLFASIYQEGAWDTAHYNQEWRRFAEAMKAADPDILLLGPDIHQFTANPAQNPRDVNGLDWMSEFLQANGDLVDVVTIHRYPFPANLANPNASMAALMASSAEWDETIPYLRSLIQEHTGRDLPIGVMEINSHWSNAASGETTPGSLANAIWWADVLGRLIRQRVDYVAHFALQTNVSQGGWGLLARNDVRPAYYVYQLYQKFGQDLLRTDFDGQSAISLYAARRHDGAITLMVINRGPNTAVETVQFIGFAPGAAAAVWRLDETHNAAPIEPLVLEPVTALTLPGYSVTLYEIPDAETTVGP
ncbi:MAG: hypothetical protein KJ063_04565 [Anaerolineae bacterium]|nr:hypothetical protein [Anaerolineae bacterium]